MVDADESGVHLSVGAERGKNMVIGKTEVQSYTFCV